MKWRDELKWTLPLAAVCFVVFANSLFGDFVYDDFRQIVRNPLIQDNSLFWKALTSDVWAFKGDGTQVASNYWRPTFTLWHIINYRLFGLEPFGWHITNVLLHAGVSVLIFGLLRRWAFAATAAFSVALIFAVHPVHVESIAWISGSPDLLFSLAFLGSLWFAGTYSETRSGKHLAISLVLYAIALGAKEIGIFCLPIYYFVLVGDQENKPGRKRFQIPLLMFGSVAAAYFLIRFAVLGAVSHPPEDALGLTEAIFSVPAMFAFYLRQIFFPYWLGANYPLESVSQIGAVNFLVPLAISLAALGAMLYFARIQPRARLAVAIFLLPLLPAMNGTAFIPEQLVHDRYLYLPLLGVLILLVILAEKYLKERNLLFMAAAIGLVLSLQTFLYNRAWKSDFSLWEHTAAIDESSFTQMQYGNELLQVRRYDEAIRALTASIEKRPTARAYLVRGRAYLLQQRYADAEADLATIMAYPLERIEAYALYQAYETLGVTYSEQRKLENAAVMFREARKKLPIYSASLTANLAVVLYQSGRKSEALKELESVRQQARREMLPASKQVFLRLGMLYAEMGRKEEARRDLQEFLQLTSAMAGDPTANDRKQAASLLEKLR